MKKNVTGSFGENYAVKLLKENGYKIIARNFRSFNGEIDIIAVQDDVLVFVEVKTRRSTRFGLPEEAVNPWKVKTISKVGEYFIKLNPNFPKKRRIDVVSLMVKGDEIISSKIIKVI